ncbi:cell wall hydrolase [Clostridium botulinum]|uniref:cell wall hydrolase n=1 Tax=Clostridium botulinum TaxID=1491 RepID=UPI0007745C57|nr:cell wall hydrolase [Clostridium botulinum]
MSMLKKSMIFFIIGIILASFLYVKFGVKKVDTVTDKNNTDRKELLKVESENLKEIRTENNNSQDDNEKGQFVIVSSNDDTDIVRKNSCNVKDSVSEVEKNKGNENSNNVIENKNINSNKSIYNDSEELDLLSRLIESEAGDEPYEGKLAVASVVMNRCKEDNESMRKVIFKKNQFDGVHTNQFNIDSSNDSRRAAREVLSGKNIVPEAYYFANLKLCDPSFAKKNNFIIRLGDHWFFKKDF